MSPVCSSMRLHPLRQWNRQEQLRYLRSDRICFRPDKTTPRAGRRIELVDRCLNVAILIPPSEHVDHAAHDEGQGDGDPETSSKEKQPLAVRVFGMNYETTEQDVRDFFRECGKIHQLTFPTFEDSGRSKGYCGIRFCSPKAVQKAIELDGQELMGRWLRIQVGKMYLKDWEALHPAPGKKRRTSDTVEARE